MKKITTKTGFIIITFLMASCHVFAQTTGTTGNWDLNGNSATGTSNFIGTRDSKPLKIKTSNAVRVTITAGGKVGIAKSSPIFLLDVKGGSINTDSIYRISGIPVISRNSNNLLQLGDNTAKIGIGTATPVSQFEVLGASRATMYLHSTTGSSNLVIERVAQDSAAVVEYRTTNGGVSTWQTGVTAGIPDFVITNSATPAITVLRSNSNVGIGTGNPQTKLDVAGQMRCTGGMEVVGTFKLSGGANGQVLTSDANGLASWQTPASGGVSGAGTASRIAFWNSTSSLASNTNLFWDNVNSRLGIGTATPGVQLELTGQIKIAGGTPGTGKVLTSDANGTASWQPAPGAGSVSGTGLAPGNIAYWTGTSTLGSPSTLFWDANAAFLGIGNSSPDVKLHITGGPDANLNSGSGFMVLGSLFGNNVVFDDNEILARNNGSASTLTLNNNGGNVVICGTNAVCNVGIGTSSPAFQLELSTNSAGKPGSSAWTVASDSRLKKDITTFSDGLNVIKKINPVWFSYNGKAGMPVNEKYVGTIAQELEKVAPYMVNNWTYEGNNGEKQNYLGVDYGAMDFIFVNAIKEQQEQLDLKTRVIEQQQKDIDDLKSKYVALEKSLSQCCNHTQPSSATEKSVGLLNEKAILEQNAPNPFSENTTIKFYIPQATNSAYIKVFGYDGSELLSIPVTTRGFGKTEISGNTLKPGIYAYMLLVDKFVADTKQMVLSR